MHANLDVVQRQKIYIPLLIVVAVTLLSASAKQSAYGGWSLMTWVQDFMGFLMVVFSTFKLFDLEGYADAFQMYDLLAKAFRPYGYLYPFIQLGLGLGYLSHRQPAVINTATAVVLGFGSLSPPCALKKTRLQRRLHGHDVSCSALCLYLDRRSRCGADGGSYVGCLR